MSWTNNSHDFDMREREMGRVERILCRYPNDLITGVEGSINLSSDVEGHISLEQQDKCQMIGLHETDKNENQASSTQLTSHPLTNDQDLL